MVRVLSTPRHLPARAKLLNPIATIEDLPHDAPWWATESAMCALGTTRAKKPSAEANRAIDYDYALSLSTLVRKAGGTRFGLFSSMGRMRDLGFGIPAPRASSNPRPTASFSVAGDPTPRLSRRKAQWRWAIGADSRSPVARRSPILPASAQTGPASGVAALLVEAALNSRPVRRVIAPADIAQTTEGCA
jgi:hypothetical protein